jgi:hypothetical protein
MLGVWEFTNKGEVLTIVGLYIIAHAHMRLPAAHLHYRATLISARVLNHSPLRPVAWQILVQLVSYG